MSHGLTREDCQVIFEALAHQAIDASPEERERLQQAAARLRDAMIELGLEEAAPVYGPQPYSKFDEDLKAHYAGMADQVLDDRRCSIFRRIAERMPSPPRRR